MSFIGLLVNACSQTAVKSCMKGCAIKSSSQFINKVVIPAGIFFTSMSAGEITQGCIENDIKELKRTVKTTKMLGDRINEIKNKGDEPEQAKKDNVVIENVFNKEGSEDGDSTNA